MFLIESNPVFFLAPSRAIDKDSVLLLTSQSWIWILGSLDIDMAIVANTKLALLLGNPSKRP